MTEDRKLSQASEDVREIDRQIYAEIQPGIKRPDQ